MDNTKVYDLEAGDEYYIMGELVSGVNKIVVHRVETPEERKKGNSDD